MKTAWLSTAAAPGSLHRLGLEGPRPLLLRGQPGGDRLADIEGYKYCFDETGKVVTDLEPIIGANGPYLIRINKQMNTTTV